MSILVQSPDGWILSHAKYFENLEVSLEPVTQFSSVSTSKQQHKHYRLDPQLFEILNPFIVNNAKTSLAAKTESTIRIENQFKALVKVGREKNVFLSRLTTKTKSENNKIARLRANIFYDAIKDLNFITKEIKLFGKNAHNYSVISEVNGHSFIFPQNTTFHCRDVEEIGNHLKDESFDLIVLDPPWRNKYVRRRKRKQSEAAYELLSSCDIGSIPIQQITQSNSLLVVWCTNAKAHQDQLINQIFPKWNVQYLTTWYWVKVTRSGEPIVPFNSEDKKQPYEAIIIGRRISDNPEIEHDDLKCLKVILSTPSSLHSHKPPLAEVLKPYLNITTIPQTIPNNLEIFARYLLPGFTSFGNEVIKLQHASLYVEAE